MIVPCMGMLTEVDSGCQTGAVFSNTKIWLCMAVLSRELAY